MKIIEKITHGFENKIGILGAGAWGIALAMHFARLDYQVFLWCYEEEIYEEILNEKGSGPFLSGMVLSKNIIPLKDMKDLFEKTTIIISTAPMIYLRETLSSAKEHFCKDSHLIISTAKGVEDETSLLPTEVVKEVLGDTGVDLFFHCFGSAKDLAIGKFSSAVLASNVLVVADFLQKKFAGPNFMINISNDVPGAIICSSFTSFLLIIFQNLDKSGMCNNFRMYFLGRCFREISSVVKILGGNVQSVLEILVSKILCSSLIVKKEVNSLKKQNTLLISKSMKKDRLMAVVPEDMAALLSIINLAQLSGILLPICQEIKKQWMCGFGETFEFQV